MTNEENAVPEETNNNQLYYILGAVLLVVVIAGGFLLRPKATTPVNPVGTEITTPIPATGPITELACENQYYNPVVGFEKYFLSAEGADINDAKEVTCTFTASVNGEVVATASAKSPLTNAPARNGSTFRCTTDALELKAEVPTTVDVTVKDDLGKSTLCTNTFLLPKP